MTFLDQQDLLSELIGDPNTDVDSAWPLAQRKAALNRGDIQFCVDSHSVREYKTDTVASNEIEIPAGWLGTFCLIIGDDVIDDWRQIDLHQWERFQNNGSEEPYYYMWEYSGTKKMKFLSGSGVNGKTYELYFFRKQTTALDADSDESIIPDEYREAPALWAANRLLKQISKFSQARKMLAEYDDGGNMIGGYFFFVGKAKSKTEKEYLQTNRAAPDTGNMSQNRGGYAQGDGGYHPYGGH